MTPRFPPVDAATEGDPTPGETRRRRWLNGLRWLSLTEGVSLLLLMGVAMPLKYLADRPGAVHVVGWVHGVLFIVLVAALAVAWRRVPIPTSLAFGVFVASLLPFGPFVVDPKLRELQVLGG